MIKRLSIAMAMAFVPLMMTVPANAQESQAKEWGLQEEEKALLAGKVVDVMCELSGNCPANCGDGERYLGIVTAEGRLVMASKNGQPAFSGAVYDLLPYCGKNVEVDGVFTGLSPTNRIYMVQLIREAGATEWSKANRFTKEWKKLGHEVEGIKGPWFRRDARVIASIEKKGWLGLGPETDAELVEWLEE